jgi:hypothetical protein
MTVIPYPYYLPDLAPCDFFLFLKMKFELKESHFDTNEDILADVQKTLETVMLEDIQRCMESWKNRWDCCKHAQRDYFK